MSTSLNKMKTEQPVRHSHMLRESQETSVRQLFVDPLYRAIFHHKMFQRLFNIPFMGVLQHIEGESSAGSRGDHSLQVALLAYSYSRRHELPKEQERLLVVSALLHDLSHPPFSHTLEFALKRQTGFAPERELYKLISVDDEECESLDTILSGFNIQKQNLPIFWPKMRRPVIFSTTHNVDTLEGITRSYRFFKGEKEGHKSVVEESKRLPWKILGMFDVSGVVQENRSADVGPLLDHFWEMKNEVYFSNIYDRRRVLFERIISYYLYSLCERKKIHHNILRFSDRDIFSIFPSLKSRVQQLWFYISKMEPEACHARGKHAKCFFDIRRFVICKKQSLLKMNQTARLHSRYVVIPYRIAISFDQRFRSDVSDILSYPLLNNHLEHIAKSAEKYLH